jgi:hypothetical protein
MFRRHSPHVIGHYAICHTFLTATCQSCNATAGVVKDLASIYKVVSLSRAKVD